MSFFPFAELNFSLLKMNFHSASSNAQDTVFDNTGLVADGEISEMSNSAAINAEFIAAPEVAGPTNLG